MSVTKLESTNFIGDVTEDIIREFKEYHWDKLPNNISATALDTTTPLEVKALNKTLCLFAKHIGLDVSNRVLSSSRVITCTRDEYNSLSKKFGVNESSMAFYDGVWRVIWIQKSSFNTPAFYLRLNHELIHATSFFEIKFDEAVDGFRRTQLGLFRLQDDTNNWRYFNEAITEMLSIHIAKRYWRSPLPDLRKRFRDHSVNISYPDQIVLVHELIKVLSLRKNVRYKKMFYYFVRAMFTGDLSSLELIKEELGEKVYRAYANLSGDERLEIIPFFETLKMDTVANRLNEYKNNKWQYSALSWL